MDISIYTQLAYYSWFAIFVVWFVGYFRTKRTARVPNWGEQIVVFVLLAVGFWTLFRSYRLPGGLLGTQIYASNLTSNLLGVALAFSGAFFAIWARIALGSNWSGTI